MTHCLWDILPFIKPKDRSLSPLANLARGTIISHHCYPQATVYVYVHYSQSTCYPQAKEYEHFFSMYVLWVWEILDSCRVCRWRGFPRTEGRIAAESVSVHPGKMLLPRTACSATPHALVHTCTQTGWSLYTVSVNKKFLYYSSFTIWHVQSFSLQKHYIKNFILSVRPTFRLIAYTNPSRIFGGLLNGSA